ncbi:peptidase C39 family protein [Amycolatopsis acidiphila]|uniref:Peptidase C39 family protein n=2 Tax=Amycolatopsis acidiphila TaxID=715473 RepID=A0A558AK30_9PSEU|nr:peptidase C39 family protein [Amycolatopsis acidiphila]TVT24618.1 peptidase C39 family protein [Amycolatopsis acidiphila]UIJ64082.1 peptidase C39 family protein [Amycolatopsis acidiphila]GHG79337.1 membrane protein [Amycolatopsis acidiphila]
MRVGNLLVVPAVAIMASMMIALPADAHPGRADDEAISYHEWHDPAARPTGRTDFGGKTYEYAQWTTSPVFRQGFGATELIASWNARTPEHTWLQVETQGETDKGAETAWYVMGRWAGSDTVFQRTSVDGQDDANAAVSVDTLVMKPGVTLRSYRLRLSLYREAGTSAMPAVSTIGAMTSNVPDRFSVPASPPGKASGVELPVPAYAQNLHKGQFPEYGGGGENWCSPTATEMVVEYWGRRPSESQLSWVPGDYVDRTVDYAARNTYDYSYEGTGNWPFNTAYAAEFGLRGHITRLHSLAELEDYVARGIPVITSQSFLASELDNAGYGTAGHIMVVIGFTKDGDVIVNDPAANSNANVRTVYKRDQFENVWLRTKRYDADGSVASGTGGIAYIITP